MVIDGEVKRERFLFSLNFQFCREHFYTQKVKSINYTAISTKPDISFIYLKLLCYLKNPLSQH